MKLTLLLAVLAGVSAQFGTDNCDKPLFLHCNSVLGDFWKVDTTSIWENLNSLSNVVDSLMTSPYGISNYVNICNGFSNFYSCLKPSGIQNCLGILGFVGSGKSPQDSYAYEGYLADWRFKCGAGFFAVYENADLTSCTQSTHKNYESQMTTYINSYINNCTVDQANACTYAQNLMNQIGTVYGNGPCRTVDQSTGYWYGCQSIREYTNAQWTHCKHITTCKTPSSTVMQEFVEFDSEGEPQFKLNGKFI